MAPQAALLVEAYPEGTVVSIDGVAVGRSGGPPLSIAADRPVVRVELRSEGFVPRRFDIAVQPGRLHVVTVELWPLVPELDGESSD